MSYAQPQAQYQLPPMPQPPLAPAPQPNYYPQPPQPPPQMYPQQNYAPQPPSGPGAYMSSPAPGPHMFARPADSASSLSLHSLSLNPTPSPRAQYYATPEDGPPYKLAVTHPDQKMLAAMRETANGVTGDISKRVAWAKQVLKYIERHQVCAPLPQFCRQRLGRDPQEVAGA